MTAAWSNPLCTNGQPAGGAACFAVITYLLLAPIAAAAAGDDSLGGPSDVAVRYDRDVRPLLARCTFQLLPSKRRT